MMLRNLSVLNYANGFTLWHYKAASVHDVMQPGWFSNASDMFATGDMVVVSAPDGGKMLFVAVDRGVVTLSALS